MLGGGCGSGAVREGRELHRLSEIRDRFIVNHRGRSGWREVVGVDVVGIVGNRNALIVFRRKYCGILWLLKLTARRRRHQHSAKHPVEVRDIVTHNEAAEKGCC